VHYVPGILREGRVTHLEPVEIEDDDEKEKYMKLQKLKDPFEKRLQPITADKPTLGLPCAWNMRRYGDPTYYPTNTKLRKPTCHGCTILESLVWPGWKMAIYV